ncbi:hypothetical protein ANPL_02050 [Anaplasma platys]|uniref:Uncharacterized protein n=1 Tax=Anaplasma platys TaxID=949 RepID=A0A858PYM3_9RICK|nr:hypothetical protein [Anaplasma platys]QJC27672.1 hypothetical protein ANPL_02050 [Anaplasma platys]
MRNHPIDLGLRLGLNATTLAKICHSETEKIDVAITNDFTAWLDRTLSLCRTSSNHQLREIALCLDSNADIKKAKDNMSVLWRMYYGSSFRLYLVGAFGQEKTDATYAWASANLTSNSRACLLYANMYKLSAFSDFKKHLARLSTQEHQLLVKLVDAVTNTPCLVECNPLHNQQLRSQVTADQASLKDRVISSILQKYILSHRAQLIYCCAHWLRGGVAC